MTIIPGPWSASELVAARRFLAMIAAMSDHDALRTLRSAGFSAAELLRAKEAIERVMARRRRSA